jgi:hypothetical protein
MIEILGYSEWIYSQTITSDHGLVGQITKCKIGDVLFYVRENSNGIDSFTINSGNNRIAAIVKDNDSLKRAVIKSRNFSNKYIENIEWYNF